MEYAFVPVLYVALAVTLGCFFFLIWKKTGFSKKYVFVIIVSIFFLIGSYTAAATVRNHFASKMLFSLYHIISTLTAGAFFQYSRAFTKIDSKFSDGQKYLIAAAAADAVLLLINPFVSILYKVSEVNYQFVSFGVTDTKIFYLYHIILIGGLIFHSVMLMIKKFREVPFVYGVKYGIMLGSISLLYMIQAVIAFTKLNPFYTIPYFAIIAFEIVIFASKSPIWEFGACQKAYTTRYNSDGLICVDYEGEIAHFNDAAKKYLNDVTEDGDILQDFVNDWFGENGGIDAKDLTWNTTKRIDNEEHHLSIVYTRMLDKYDKFIGGSFLIHDRTDEVISINKEIYNANHDALTGLYTKEHFCSVAYSRIKSNPAIQYLIICCDVKSFKLINEIFGVKKGDEVLHKMGESIRRTTSNHSVYGRFGGDSFAICMPKDLYDERIFKEKAEELSSLLNSEYHKIHVHFGVYEVNKDDESIQIMCDRAFLAIRGIKESYESVIAVYTENMRKQYMHKQQINVEFEKALLDGCFIPYIQPQCLADKTSHGGEVLVRWKKKDGTIVSPKEFLTTYEESGLIGRLDMYIWEAACKQLSNWKKKGINNVYLSINISPKDFYLMDVYKVITGLINKYHLSPRNLNLEITETSIMNDLEKTNEIIDKFHKHNFVVEMDDFGSGNSSLNMLKDVNIDIIKADMCFLQETDNSERSETILNHVIALALDLGHGLIVEGVETEEQLNMLKDKGCKGFQGYYFDKPITFDEYEKKYITKNQK